jgi:type 1 fimbriae regulatory protein FimB/type 1 fimbriae regulatory protein FimE
MAEININPDPEQSQAGETSSACETLPKVRILGRVGRADVSKTATLRLVSDEAPLRILGRVPPRKPKNKDRRHREHLTETEVERLAVAAGNCGRHRHRDRTMVMVCYRHGLRVKELVSLEWDQVNLDEALLTVHRVKKGLAGEHPISGDELRALRRLKREQQPGSPFVFMTERGAPMTERAFRLLLSRAGEKAGLSLCVHPHMLRHAAGYKLVNDRQPIRAIQQYLGHRRIASTERYTEIDARQFKAFFR